MPSHSSLPTPQQELAFQTLEISFNNAPLLKTHKPLQGRPGEAHSYFPSARPIRQLSYSDNSSTGATDTTPVVSPSVTSPQDSGLPPTPPSTNSQENVPQLGQASPSLADGPMAAFKPSLTTPTSQQSPPTPDPSPPRTTESLSRLRSIVPPVDVLRRPPVLQYPSSRAESFTTAREDFSSTATTPTPDAHGLDGARERGLGFKYEEDVRRNRDSTPVQSKKPQLNHHEKTLEDLPRDMILSDLDSIPNREWDTNLMRNVTVRKKRRTKPSPMTHADETLSNNNDISPTPSNIKREFSMRKRLQKDGASPPSIRSNEIAALDSPQTSEASMQWGGHLKGDDGRRLSGSSFSSTVVEAIVMITPQPSRQTTLRHAGRNLAYRSVSEGVSVDVMPARTNSRRTLPTQDGSPTHRLHHQKARIPERRDRSRISSEIAAEVASPNLAAAVHQSPKRTIEVTVPRKQIKSQSAFEIPAEKRSISSPLPERPSSRHLDDVSINGSPKHSNGRPTSTSSSRDTFLSATQPKTMKTLPKANEVVPDTLVSHENIKLHNSIQDALPEIRQTVVKTDSTAPSTTILKPPVTSLAVLSEDQDKGVDTPAKAERKADLPIEALSKEQGLHIDMQRATEADPGPRSIQSLMESTPGAFPPEKSLTGPQQAPTYPEGRRRVSLAPTEDIPRQSLEGTGFHHDDKRRSSDHLTVRTDDHMSPRQYLSPGTPFSNFSSPTPDALEVREATAVSIYPHNNNSLLVVQHVAPSRSNTVSYRNTSEGPSGSLPLISALQPSPLLTFEPSTPPQTGIAPQQVAIDSPLSNPRKPPTPPAFKIIPPTPAEELDRQLPGPPDDENRPRRRISLKERARRYSDQLMGPMLGRSFVPNGLRRTLSNPPPVRRVPSVKDETDGKLHPFWRPRGFWDDFSDSDSDSDFGDFDTDRLPEGGDTSDVAEEINAGSSRRIAVLGRRLTNGFKGSGGFLVGNSLGLERGPTNRRRHHVSLPINTRKGAVKDADSNRRATTQVLETTSPHRNDSPGLGPASRGGRLSPLYVLPNRSIHASSTFSRSTATIAQASRLRRLRKGLKRAHRLPGFKLEVQYVGFRGMKDRWVEKRAEKRREELRGRIGPRWTVEGNGVV